MNAPGPLADIAQAERLIQNTTGPIAHQSLRAACWMLRGALEHAVQNLLIGQGIDVAGATTRSTHLCLQALYLESAPELVRDVASSWDRLSRAVHHHAFELSPTYSEVRDMADTVQRITEFAQPAGERRPGHLSDQDLDDVALEVR